jgi:hypothetical protein
MPDSDTRLVMVHAGFDQPIRVVLYQGADRLGRLYRYGLWVIATFSSGLEHVTSTEPSLLSRSINL